MKVNTLRSGHDQVGLHKNGRTQMRYVHTLVIEAFIAPRPGRLQCRHIDKIPNNNVAWNLVWGTIIGFSEGSKTDSILSTTDVHEIRNALKNGARCVDVARERKLLTSTVHSIYQKRTWGWLE